MTCLAVGVLLPKSVKKFINHLYCSPWSIMENNSSKEENRYKIAEQVKPGRNDILCPPHLTKPNGHKCNTEYWILNILEKWNVEIWPPHNRSSVEFCSVTSLKGIQQRPRSKSLKAKHKVQSCSLFHQLSTHKVHGYTCPQCDIIGLLYYIFLYPNHPIFLATTTSTSPSMKNLDCCYQYLMRQ